ncbi:MAG: DUF2336 domain-containing protein [Alphaproteobacteria bacterium]
MADAPLSYEEASEMANHEDVQVRRTLAAREDAEPEILYYLAEFDTDPEVRRIVAANAAAPRHTYTLLANDDDEGVRSDLAEKLARLAPDLSDDERDQLRHSTHEALDLLAQDQMTRVRSILSEILKDVAGAPPEVIKRLAADDTLEVAGPVLEFSPVLTDADLIEIIAGGTVKGGLNAISRRHEVGDGVSDAIVATDDEEAIADLLGNKTAQIREQTLDDLIARADKVELWHAPLVSRPKLPSGAETRLARFVADNLLEKLTERDGMDDKTLEAVKSMVHHRLKSGDRKKNLPTAGALEFLKIEPPIGVVERLMSADRLDLNVISKALHSGDHSFVLAALTVRSQLSLQVLREIFSSHSAKGIVSAVWKAGLPMDIAVQVQRRMAGIAPEEFLEGKTKGAFPLTTDEMEWQLSYYAEQANK